MVAARCGMAAATRICFISDDMYLALPQLQGSQSEAAVLANHCRCRRQPDLSILELAATNAAYSGRSLRWQRSRGARGRRPPASYAPFGGGVGEQFQKRYLVDRRQ